MTNNLRFPIHLHGEKYEFVPRAHPWTSVAGQRFGRAHEGAMAVASVLGVQELPPGVLGELMRVLLSGPHESVDWEYDVPKVLIETILAAVSLPESDPVLNDTTV